MHSGQTANGWQGPAHYSQNMKTPADRIYLAPPSVGPREIARVTAALESGWVAPVGPELDGFEADLRTFAGVGGAVALSSGTAGLHLGLKALGVEPEDEVFCPTLTFAATAFAVVHAGANPVFLDSEPVSWNLDPEVLEATLRMRARRSALPAALITVDIFGRTSDYAEILPIAEHFGVPVLVDSAESLGARHGEAAAGSMGHAGVYSFNGNKIMTTSGGGMFVSNDEQLVEKVRYWSTQARENLPWYEHNDIGFNYRMSNILAALGRAQLERLPEIIASRRQVREWYAAELAETPAATVTSDPPWGRSNAWLTTVRFDRAHAPDAAIRVREALEAQNIESRPVWKPMHQQPVFADREAHLTGVSDLLYAEGLCLPSGFELQYSDIERICAVIVDTLAT